MFAGSLLANNGKGNEINGKLGLRFNDCFNEQHKGPKTKYVIFDEKTRKLEELDVSQLDIKTLKPGKRVKVKGVYKNHPIHPGKKVFEGTQLTYGTEVNAGDGGVETNPENEEPTGSGGETTAITQLSCLLIFANSSDKTYSETKKDIITDMLFGGDRNANEAIQHATYGNYGLSLGNIITVDVSLPAVSEVSSMEAAMIEAAALAGYSESNYGRTLIFCPDGIVSDGSGWTAYAYYGIPRSVWSYGWTGTFFDAIVHELGHNFGFSHSGKDTNEYGDRTCVMGYSHSSTASPRYSATYSATKKLQAGWLSESEGSKINLSTDATFNLYPISESPDLTTGLRSVQINGSNVFVSYARYQTPYAWMRYSSDGDKVFIHSCDLSQPNGLKNSWRENEMTSGVSYTAGNTVIKFERHGNNNEFATVSFDLDDGNTKPVAISQSVSTNMNTPVAFSLTGSDIDGDTLSYNIVETSNMGTLSGTAPNLIYTPNTAYIGSESILFEVNDGKISSFATVTMIVLPPPTWSDEFNGTGAPDTQTWTFEEGYVRNNEDQYYQNQNAWQEGGDLIFEARRDDNGKPYTSASIHSDNKYSFQYGRMQIRAKIPAVTGMWPAIWTCGDNGEWPSNGECDIMEYYTGKILANCAVGTNTRWTAKWDSAQKSMSALNELDSNWKDQYHIWTMQWDEDNVRLYVDGILLNTISQSWLVNSTTQWGPAEPFKQSHFLRLNLAVGGNAGGDPSNATFPQRYYVDYVRVWENYTSNTAPISISLSNLSIQEGLPLGSDVGNLSAVDTDPAEVIRYSLVSGEGDTDNAFFIIANLSDSTTSMMLKTNRAINDLDGSTRSVRIRATDIEGATVDQIFSIAVASNETLVHYHANGGETGITPMDINSYNVNDSVTVLENSGGLEKTGCTLIGWNTLTDGTGVTYSAGDSFIFTQSTTLYALWVPITQVPYSGSPAGIPGIIEVEEYDLGGDGVAYNDTSNGNSGGDFRTDNVDIKATADIGGGYNVGWMSSGEWLEYTVDVESSGAYDLDLRVASDSGTGSLQISFSGVDKTGSINFSPTGGWQTWSTVSVSDVQLDAGVQVMRININASNWNFNKITFSSNQISNSAPVAWDGSFNTEQDTPVVVNLVATDSDGDPLTYTVITGPVNGSLSGTLPNMTYTPDVGYFGSDNFIFKVNDGNEDSNTATVSITVNEVIPQNNAPVVNAGIDQTLFLDNVGPWTPAQLTSVGWFDASDVGSLIVDGDQVSQLSDKSGTSNHLLSSGTNQPAYSTTGWDGILPAIDFNGGQMYLQLETALDFPDGLTIISLFDQDTTGNDTSRPFGVRSTASNKRTFAFSNDNSLRYDGAKALSATPASTGKHLRVATKSADAKAQTDYLDGELNISSSVSLSDSNGVYLNIGSPSYGYYNNFDGRIAECIVIAGVISDEDRQKVEGYLAHKWGVAVNLPSDHPYRSVAPGGTALVANLDGNVSDPDGDNLATTWVQVSGPDTISFDDVTFEDTSLTISEVGTYVLRLTANDGNIEAWDDVTIIVQDSVVNVAPLAHDDSVSTTEDNSIGITLLASDANGDDLNYSIISQPVNGTLTGNAPDLTYTPNAGYVGSDSFLFMADDGEFASDAAMITISVEQLTEMLDIGLSNGVLNSVDGSWQTVYLPRAYTSMVVVASPIYTNASVPMVPRIRNAVSNSFEIKLQNPGDLNTVPTTSVHYTVVEEGIYNLTDHGINMEAVKYSSTITDKKGSLVGESRSYANFYTNPVVIGQVMTFNDLNWSVFWCRGVKFTDAPSASSLYTGKGVYEDSNFNRENETIGYLVIEAGTVSLGDKTLTANIGTDTVKGMGDNPAYTYSISASSTVQTVVLSVAGLDGADGGWAVLYNEPSQTTLNLAIDEDQIGDSERAHTSEPVSYLIIQ